jgi:lipopolysaccharide transport system ATP-binding protein
VNRPIIEVRGVSKAYRLGEIGARSLREELATKWSRARGAARPSASPQTLWALRDVSFDVQRGEVLGIIGRNGAGKSTLLKIMSRITQQTSGEIVLRGRVASLLEVGTGFHPDLSGRENIFLNGAILGMTKAEIRAKLDEIVAFAEIDRFLDTPVKRYSSGMYVRLAFAVAAHLEPEILVVDEVLAVGDAAFQQKCLGRMNNLAGEGRTVLFVSHNMAAVRSLCGRALCLDGGMAIADGPTERVVSTYLQRAMGSTTVPLATRTDRAGNGRVRFTGMSIESVEHGEVISSGSRLRISLSYCTNGPPGRLVFLVGVYDLLNAGIYALNSDDAPGIPQVLPGEGTVTAITDPINLTAGHCYLNIAVTLDGAMADHIQHAAAFEVCADQSGGAGAPSREWVLCTLKHRWSAGVDVAPHAYSGV